MNGNPLSKIDPLGLVTFYDNAGGGGRVNTIGPSSSSGPNSLGNGMSSIGGAGLGILMSISGDTSTSTSSDNSRTVPYPERKRGKYTCICRANKGGRRPDNCSIDNKDFAMGYGEGSTLMDAKRAAEKDAKDKLGAKSTHHVQCRCTSPTGGRIIPTR